MKEIISLIEKLMGNQFYGTIEIQFRAGKPFLIRKTQTIIVNSDEDKETDEDTQHNR